MAGLVVENAFVLAWGLGNADDRNVFVGRRPVDQVGCDLQFAKTCWPGLSQHGKRQRIDVLLAQSPGPRLGPGNKGWVEIEKEVFPRVRLVVASLLVLQL